MEKTLREADIGNQTGAIIVAVYDQAGKLRVTPTTVALSDLVLQEKDVLIALGKEEQITQLSDLAQGREKKG